MRITVFARSNRRFVSCTSGTTLEFATSPVEQAASCRASSIAYGSGFGSIRPGVSICVESISANPASGRTCAVPRRSRISSMLVPAARRCAISTIARSALPYTSRSAFESIKIDRLTLSDQ
jgi:hypothetical protein